MSNVKCQMSKTLDVLFIIRPVSVMERHLTLIVGTRFLANFLIACRTVFHLMSHPEAA